MDAHVFDRIAKQAPFHDAGHGFDVFGLHPPALASAVSASAPIYERYFRVESRGAEHVPADGPAILVANHAGVLPVDGAMLCLDVLRRTDPPRIPRAIADRFVPRVPLVATAFARFGVVSGTRANVRYLLEHGELLAIWPEGVSGTGQYGAPNACTPSLPASGQLSSAPRIATGTTVARWRIASSAKPTRHCCR